MEKLILRTKLFGYDKMEVVDYVSALNEKYYKQLEEFQKKLEEERKNWQAQMDSLRREQEEELQKWQAQLERLRREQEEQQGLWQEKLKAAHLEGKQEEDELRRQVEVLTKERNELLNGRSAVADVLFMAQEHAGSIRAAAEKQVSEYRAENLRDYQMQQKRIDDYEKRFVELIRVIHGLMEHMEEEFGEKLDDMHMIRSELKQGEQSLLHLIRTDSK